MFQMAVPTKGEQSRSQFQWGKIIGFQVSTACEVRRESKDCPATDCSTQGNTGQVGASLGFSSLQLISLRKAKDHIFAYKIYAAQFSLCWKITLTIIFKNVSDEFNRSHGPKHATSNKHSVLCALGESAQPLWALAHSSVKGRPSDPLLHTDCENKEVRKSILGPSCLCICYCCAYCS